MADDFENVPGGMSQHALEDRAYRQSELRSRGGGGGGKGRGKGGGRSGGGGGGQGRDVQISKALSKLLRHQALTAGISLDDEGFAPLDKVVRYSIFWCVW
jgi:2'-phosphotransferase